MSRWVDVKVPARDALDALNALAQGLEPLTISYNAQPPSTPGQHVISVENKPRELIAVVLSRAGISAELSTRLGRPLRADTSTA